MPRAVVTRTIEAPADTVFRTVAHIDQFSQAIPHIVKVEFLSDVRTGVGTRFRETRRMKGKESTVELEVTEYVPGERVRIVADTHGTVWDTVFTVAPSAGGTLLTMAMEARPHRLLSRLMTPMVMGVIRKALEDDLDAVKAFCER